MRVIIVHNRYQNVVPSGENIVVNDEIALLRSSGVDIETVMYTSDEIERFSKSQRAGLAISPSYARRAIRQVEQLIDTHQPDLMHIHNVYPLISPEIIRVAKRRGVRVVHSVHNYRLACSNGTFFRDGQTCTDCLGRRFGWPGVVHQCYRGSRLQSLVMASSLALHDNTWRMVDGFFVLHDFARRYLEEVGIHADRIHLKSNMVPDTGSPRPRASGFVYAGRLDVSKGVPLLLDAWARCDFGADVKLTIAGDGPLHEYVAGRAQRLRNVEFVGRVERARVLELIDAASAVVVPSLWFEGAPLVISEGASRGRPALVTRMGGLPELVTGGRGWVAEPTDAGIATALLDAHCVSDARWNQMSGVCRASYRKTSSPEAVLDRLMALYEHTPDHEILIA